MKTIAKFYCLLFSMILVSVDNAKATPEYASDESRRVIEAMIEAHGGYDIWKNAPAIRFDDIMHNNFHEKDQFAWWAAHEVIDQKTRKVWQNWPMDDARIGYDGEKVWSEGWQKGNPAPSMVHFFYYFVNLVWLTQDDGVVLSEVTRFDEWPGIEKNLYEVHMTFDLAPGIGKSSNGYFVLYIDPDDYRLVGYQYANGYRPLLEAMGMPERKVFGPLWRTITRYENVDGLLFPSAFRTSPEPGKQIVGNHLILNIDISTPFEHEKAEIPDDAEVYRGPLSTD